MEITMRMNWTKQMENERSQKNRENSRLRIVSLALTNRARVRYAMNAKYFTPFIVCIIISSYYWKKKQLYWRYCPFSNSNDNKKKTQLWHCICGGSVSERRIGMLTMLYMERNKREQLSGEYVTFCLSGETFCLYFLSDSSSPLLI